MKPPNSPKAGDIVRVIVALNDPDLPKTGLEPARVEQATATGFVAFPRRGDRFRDGSTSKTLDFDDFDRMWI